MGIKTLKEFIDSDGENLLVFQSPVAITCNQHKYYVLLKDAKPEKGTRKGYFEPIPLQTPTDSYEGTEGVGIPIRQHLDDPVILER
jgi:hypothetical protein